MIQRIADASHPALAPYREVGDPAALERRGLFVAEGRLVVERLIAERPRFSIESIVEIITNKYNVVADKLFPSSGMN